MDGVLTNGQLLIMPDGELLRSMNIKDGYAMQLAVKKGYHVIIISGGTSQGAASRLQRLGVTDTYMQVTNKMETYISIKLKHAVTDEQVLFMGDDIPDIEILKEAGVSACPADASHDVKSVCMYRSLLKGGEGCVRDVIEQVLRVQGKWADE